jgi:hypothetical protein
MVALLAPLSALHLWVLTGLSLVDGDPLARDLDPAWVVGVAVVTTVAAATVTPIPRATAQPTPPFAVQFGMAAFLLLMLVASASGLAVRLGYG